MIADPQSPPLRAHRLAPSCPSGPELSKYQGVHRQEDRDARSTVRATGAGKKTWNMVGIRIAMGTLSAEQYLAMDELSHRVTYNRSLRATAGRSLQLHGISEDDLANALDTVATAGLSAGCSPLGLEFAVAGPPSPLARLEYERLRAIDASLCAAFYPTPGPAIESPGHAPRKFSIGLALPEDNSANAYANDVGLILLGGAGPAPRVNILVGGGLSMPGRRPGAYARIGTPIGSVTLDDVLPAVRGVAGIFREHGEIATRWFTRLKYVVDQLGTEPFRSRLNELLNRRLEEWVPMPEFSARGWLGPHDQGNGLAYYGIKVPNGRIVPCMTAWKSPSRICISTCTRKTMSFSPRCSRPSKSRKRRGLKGRPNTDSGLPVPKPLNYARRVKTIHFRLAGGSERLNSGRVRWVYGR